MISVSPRALGTSPAVVVGGTTAVQALISAGSLAFPAIAPQAAAALGTPAVLIGAQVSLVYATATAVSLLGGRIMLRLGAGRTSQIALVLLAAGLLIAALPSVPAVVLGSLVIGAGYGLPNPAAAHLLHRYTGPRRRNLVFSIKQTGVPLGGALAGLVAPALADGAGWQAPLLAFAAAALVLAAFIGTVRESWDDDRQPNATLSQGLGPILAQVLSVRPLRRLLVVGFLLAGVQLVVNAFTVLLLVSDHGFSPVAAGGVLAAVQMGGVAGRLAWGALADRIGDGRRVLIAVALGIALLASVLQLAAGPTLVLAFVALGATAIGWNGVFLAEVARLAPERRVGDAIAVVLAGTYLGVCVGPALFSAVAPGFPSYGSAFVLLGGSALVATVILAGLRRN